MLDFLGVTEHFSCMENTPFSFPALFRDMAGGRFSGRRDFFREHCIRQSGDGRDFH